MRCTNDALALKALADGVAWTAVGWDGRAWVQKRVEGGVLCQDILQSLFSILPLEPFRADDGTTRPAGRPRGFIQWKMDLVGGGVSVPSGKDVPAWQTTVSETAPTATALVSLYKSKLGCNRNGEDNACASPTCAFCWRGRPGLTHGTVFCFNEWAVAPAEASAGTGTLRGGQVKEAADSPDTWLFSENSRGNDVEIYVDDSAKRAGRRGFRLTTLGRIAYCFDHQGNDRRIENAEERQEGEWTVWVAVQEFVTAGVGNTKNS